MDARPEDAGYGFRTQETELKNRINTLFSHKDDDNEGGARAEEEYETVNEGMTTDTTEAPQQAARRGSAEEVSGEKASSGTAEKEEGEAEGILSSDEESVATSAAGKVKVTDKPIIDRGDNEIRGFAAADGGAARSIFESDKAKEEVENKFSFSEQDVEYFGAKLQSRSDRDLGVMAEERKRTDDDDHSYVTSKFH